MTDIARKARGGSAVRPSPVFLAIVAVTVLAGLVTWRYGQITDQPARIALFVFVLAGWVLSLCLHEFGHAFTAFRSGDHSVATKGYLTLNPFKYADMVLSFAIPVLFILLGGIGLPGGAVWIDRHAIRGKIRHSLISAAGPLSNIVFAAVLAVLLNLFADDSHSIFWVGVAFLAFLQVTAAVLNLLPIPGLDGFGIVEPYLPRSWVRQANQYAGYAFLVLVALLWLGPINEGFFNLVYYITDAIGLEELQITIGHALFQFWRQ
ncbi:hypothetical protein BJF79_10510 [Actinomadura sp. CNU-125]|uniref:site-2 protease family protein n=1 Tax=Actinomadura sp. CNU-125 TaxID=1904961 RepID=UPI00095E687C|nr:site-2 protease family protein [Actinomadura sp. CNU-125]OLT29556.1 hypothetical protein BJF79_10510 [Actinomadura sp. CNU-125]